MLRGLGGPMATAVVVGTVIGSGIFVKPRSIAGNVPDFSYIALLWVTGGLLTLLGALALAEVAVLFPKAGGNYVFLREGYGRMAGFLWGWVEFWIIRAASLAALATIFTISLHDILRQLEGGSEVLLFWEERAVTAGVILALALVNVRGVRWGGGLQLFITMVKVLSLAAIMVLPIVIVSRAVAVEPRNLVLRPAPEFSLGGMGTAFLGVLWAYHGWMNLAPVAEEVARPQRNIPIAFLGGVGIIIFCYLGVNYAYHAVVPQREMAVLPESTTVATEFCSRLLGPIGVLLASTAVMCSVFGALNGNLLVGPRLLYAMGEDGLAPRALGAVHPRYHTPARAILVMASWAVLLVLAVALGIQLEVLDPMKSPFDVLTDYAMFGAITFETLAVTTIFVFRRKLPDANRSYRCWGYPVVPIVYLILPALLLGNMFLKQTTEAAAGMAFIALGAAVYAFFLMKPARAD
ncbi:MAG: amino acid permease [Planctomycetes bacterium]|nr:amino acid permease [Planctomycetota bacterium]